MEATKKTTPPPLMKVQSLRVVTRHETSPKSASKKSSSIKFTPKSMQQVNGGGVKPLEINWLAQGASKVSPDVDPVPLAPRRDVLPVVSVSLTSRARSTTQRSSTTLRPNLRQQWINNRPVWIEEQVSDLADTEIKVDPQPAKVIQQAEVIIQMPTEMGTSNRRVPSSVAPLSAGQMKPRRAGKHAMPAHKQQRGSHALQAMQHLRSITQDGANALYKDPVF